MIFNEKYSFFDTFIFRTPINPFTEFNKSSFSQIFKESLYLASPDLYEAIESSERKKEKISGKLEESIYKYLSRTHYRSTPFGSFSGVGVGKIGGDSGIFLKDSSEHRTLTRLDMTYLCSLIEHFCSDTVVLQELNYKVNSSLYKLHNDYRYVEYKIEENKRNYFLSEIDSDDAIDFLCDSVVTYTSYQSIVLMFINQFEVSEDEAKEYVNSLITNQILVSDLEANVSGENLLDNIILKLKNVVNFSEKLEVLEKVNGLIKKADNTILGNKIPFYNEIEMLLKEINIPFQKQLLFQSDLLIVSDRANISKSIVSGLNQGISLLNKLSRPHKNEALNKFKRDFHRRYENSMVPLAIVLDADVGIGIANLNSSSTDLTPLLKKRYFSSGKSDSSFTVSEQDVFLNKKYRDFITANEKELIITDEDISQFQENWEDQSKTFSAFVEILNIDSVDDPELYLSYVNGGSAGNLIARFSHLDYQIDSHLNEIYQKEDEILGSSKILAEVVHLPQSRNGNILFRNSTRTYEIPYLAQSLKDDEFQIPLNDLLVWVPNGEKIILWSKKHNKEVIPKNTNAYNYSLNPVAVHQFLCMLQGQNREALMFNWGNLLSEETYLPRVRYKKIILSPATWKIKPALVSHFKSIIDTELFYSEAQEFAKKMNIPSKVYLVAGDNKLFIDFEDSLSVKILFKSLIKSGGVLQECFNYEKSLIKSDKGSHMNELIINYYSKEND